MKHASTGIIRKEAKLGSEGSRSALNLAANYFRLTLSWLIDWLVPIRADQICFVSRHYMPICGNLRIMIDELSSDKSIKVIAYREGNTDPLAAIALQEKGVELIQRYSLRAHVKLLSSELIVLSHRAADAYIVKKKKGRKVVNLWHGVANKRIEAMMPDGKSAFLTWLRKARIKNNSKIYDAMIASNPVDQLVNSLAFNVNHAKVHPIGLPRFDYLINSWQEWPSDLRQKRKELESLLDGRRLLLYAPTFRNKEQPFSDIFREQDHHVVRTFCKRNNYLFGLRVHPYWEGQQQCICDGSVIVDIGSKNYPEPAVALSIADVLITDYSSIWIDYLLLNRQIIGLMPDLDRYLKADRGFIYPYLDVFPGPRTSNWVETIDLIQSGLELAHLRQDTLFLPWNYSSRSAKECKKLLLRNISSRLDSCLT